MTRRHRADLRPDRFLPGWAGDLWLTLKES
jgi:hypothetical protein